MTARKEKLNVGIIGFGRFGPVLARLLSPGHNILAYDIEDITAAAESAGVRVVPLEMVVQVDTLFLAVPIRRFKEAVAQLVPLVQPGTTVIDVCSVKVYPATVMKEHFSPEITTIATHPLFGPDSSQHGFAGLPMVMHPVSPKTGTFDRWTAYFKEQGINVLDMAPKEHDKLAALSQGVTHFVGRALQEFGIAPTPIDTEGFRDLQLVVEQTCHDSPELFQDLERFNPYTTDMIKKLVKSVNTVQKNITRSN